MWFRIQYIVALHKRETDQGAGNPVEAAVTRVWCVRIVKCAEAVCCAVVWCCVAVQ